MCDRLKETETDQEKDQGALDTFLNSPVLSSNVLLSLGKLLKETVHYSPFFFHSDISATASPLLRAKQTRV